MQTTGIGVDQTERHSVVFVLAGEHYGVDVADVWEIIRMVNITPLPAAPDFVQGMINLRGKVIPVVDLRERFGLKSTPPGKDTRILVVDVEGEDIGIVVDAVIEVKRIPLSAIEPTASVLTLEQSAFVDGVANLDGRLVILLDMAEVLTREQLAAARPPASYAPSGAAVESEGDDIAVQPDARAQHKRRRPERAA